MKQEIYDTKIETVEKESYKRQFFLSKTVNTVTPVILSTSSLVLAYQFSLGLLYYIVLPLALLSVYYLIWLSFKIARLQYDNHILNNKIDETMRQNEKMDVIIKQNEKLYEYANSLTIKKFLEKRYLEPLKHGETEIYIKYKKLNIYFLSDFLKEYENFYLLLYGVFNTEIELEKYYQNEKFEKTKFIESVKMFMKGRPEDILVLKHVYTGESIKIRPHTSWKIDWNYCEGDFYLYAPKGIFTFIFASMILGAATSWGLSQYQKILEIIKTHREIYNESYFKTQHIIDKNVFRLADEFKYLPEFVKEAITDTTNNILEMTVRDENIQEFTIKVSR